MQVTVTVAAGGGFERNVEVCAPEPMTAAQLAIRLGLLLDLDRAPALSSSGRPIPDDALLGGPTLRHGERLVLGPAGPRSTLSSSVLEARVISGPDCGLRAPLTRRTHVIGRSPDADIVIADQDISRHHVELTVSNTGVQVRDLSSTNGVCIDGVRIGEQSARLELGQLLQLGMTTVTVTGGSEPPAAVRTTGEGVLVVHRPPRLRRPDTGAAVEFPALLPADRRPATQWLATLLPALLGVALAAAMRNIEFLAFALLTPMSLLGGSLAERRSRRRELREASARFLAAEAAAASKLSASLAAEAAQRRRAHPDAAAVAHTAALPDCRLWERRATDRDFLTVRVGVADQPARVAAARAGVPFGGHRVGAAPVVLDLKKGALGVAGPVPYARGLARWVIAQLLTLHSPNDLSLVLLVDGSAQDWQWTRWQAGRVATTARERAEAVEALSYLLATRLRARTSNQAWQGPWTVVLIDPSQLGADPGGVRALLRDGPSVGITAVCVAAHPRLLPHECHAVANLRSALGDRLDVRVADEPGVADAVCERVGVEWAEQVGRDLAPLRDSGVDGGAIADEVRLVDVLGLSDISDNALLRRWGSGGRPSTALGVSARGNFVIDLVRDGPHGLIAGSTGSGKSELLRSLVAGLATANSPADLAFVLIDYKGGAAFAECAELPHTIAMITDLDPHLTRRALISLDAELRRREGLFAVAGVSELDAYRRCRHGADAPLPRLVLVVDEFASLAEEFPDFINGLVAIAQRGRSLGVHLLLATQRPNGVVSAEIKANMALRVALRVTDPADSADILGTADAAGIDKNQPGRGFARLADGLVEFQTGRVDTPAPVVEGAQLRLLDEWNRRPSAAEAPEDAKADLRLLVDAARQAAHRSRVRPPDPVWLPPLPLVLPAADVHTDQDDRYVVEFGLVDRSVLQRRTPLSHDLASGGSLAFIGQPRSGRTTALRTVAALAAGQLGPGDLQLYAIDCAGGSLRGLAQLPSCATMLPGDDPAAVARLVALLSAELDGRLSRLAQGALGDAAEARRHGWAIPPVLIVLDGWEGFASLSDSHDAGRTAELLLRVARDGPAAGFSVILAGDRALLGVRTSAAIGRKLVLRLTEASDYGAAGISARSVPARLPPGRAITADDAAETQLAVLGDDPSAAAQWAAVAAIARRQRAEPGAGSGGAPGPDDHPPQRCAGPPIRIRPLPERVRLSELGPREGLVRLGRGGDGASVIGADLLRDHSRFLIAGPARSGRSTAAILIASQAVAAGVSVLIAGPRFSPLVGWGRECDLPLLGPDDRCPAGESGAELIVVDDCETFADADSGMWLVEMVNRASASVVACARSEDLLTSFRGVAVAVKRSRAGLLLQPSALDGEMLGVRITPSRLAIPPGRGLLMTDELRVDHPGGLPIQVATA